jgi:hypothetical protein
MLPLVSTRLTQKLIQRQQFRRSAICWISIQRCQQIPRFWTNNAFRFEPELTPPSWWCVGHHSARCILIRGGPRGKGWWSRGAWNGPTDDYLAPCYCHSSLSIVRFSDRLGGLIVPNSSSPSPLSSSSIPSTVLLRVATLAKDLLASSYCQT